MKQLRWWVLLFISFSLVPVANAHQPAMDRVEWLFPESTLDRPLEPVIVRGEQMPAFLGTPTDQLFAYAYRDGGWEQIPAQVDEVSGEGVYVAHEDGVWDANDELVLMAGDVGDWAGKKVPLEDSDVVGLFWYEIEVVNPVAPAHKGWAYIVRSSDLGPTFAEDYVDFDPVFQRVTGTHYRLGFAGLRPWMDYLTLGDHEVDILDRTKVRLFCEVQFVCPIKENIVRGEDTTVIKDGPVRVIARGGNLLAYGSQVLWTRSGRMPEEVAGDIQYSTDFNNAVVGATFYNATVPDGVIVDGNPDIVPDTPFSPWWQLSTDMGTLVQVWDTRLLPATLRNYYLDDAAVDPSDTGDWRHYGDNGIYISNPDRTLAIHSTYYFLPERLNNVGATYLQYFEQPLAVRGMVRTNPKSPKVYLPVILH